MNIKGFISKYKMYLILGWVVLILVLFIVYKSLITKPVNYINVQNTENLSFVYPEGWNEETKNSSTEGFKNESSVINSPDGLFTITVTYEDMSDSMLEEIQTPEVTGGDLSFIAMPYNSDDFEIIAKINESELLVSKTGNCIADVGTMISVTPKTSIPNYVFQKYDTGISQMLSLIQYGEGENPRAYRNVIVSYTFNDVAAFENWSEYKEILKEIVKSLSKK